MRKALLLLLAAGVALTFAATARAGCWATVGVNPLPKGMAAGATWTANVQVLQHGRTPMADASPAVLIRNSETGEERSVPATPIDGSQGIYRAAVVFPSEGSWSVAVNDGFPVPECAQTHAFGSFAISASAPPAEPPASPSLEQAPSLAAAAKAKQTGASIALPLALGLGLGFGALAVAGVLAIRARHGRATRAA